MNNKRYTGRTWPAKFCLLRLFPQKKHPLKAVDKKEWHLHIACHESWVSILALDQWFSTFFSSRHTKDRRKFGGTLTPKSFVKYFKKSIFCQKRIGKVRNKNIWRHTWNKFAAHKCAAAHRLRNTALDQQTIFGVSHTWPHKLFKAFFHLLFSQAFVFENHMFCHHKIFGTMTSFMRVPFNRR